MRSRSRMLVALALALFIAAPLVADTLSLKQQAKNAFELKKYPRAQALARQATEENPNDAEAWFLLGKSTHYRCYDTRPLSGQTRATSDSILSFLGRAVQLDPKFGEAYYFTGAEYGARCMDALCRGDAEQARAELRAARAKNAYPDWALEYSRNMLRSCAQDAILFMDHDIIVSGIRYLQLVEGYRPDITTIVTMGRARLTLPYKEGVPGAIRPAPISWSREQILSMQSYPWNTDTVRIPVKSEVLKRLGISSPDTVMELAVEPASPERPMLSANAAQIIDIVETNQWRRPIYFSEPTRLSYIDSYLQDCGLVQRLLPVRGDQYGLEQDTTTIKRVLLDSASYRDIATYRNHSMPTQSGILFAYRVGLVGLAVHYDDTGDSIARNRVLDQMAALIPDSLLPMPPNSAQFIARLRKGLKSSVVGSASPFAKDTIPLQRLTGRLTRVAYDDDSADGRESFLSGGEACTFGTPDTGKWYITALSIHGRRFGPSESAGDTFNIALCDSEFRTVTTWPRPYSAFAQDSSGWVRFNLPPTRVPGHFGIILYFRATAEKGVYVSADAGTHGHSFYIVPGSAAAPYESGDWMIRIELDHPKQP